MKATFAGKEGCIRVEKQSALVLPISIICLSRRLVLTDFPPFQSHYVRTSEPLSALLQADRMSRPQVVKQLWVYIKDNSLQNPNNKREILCDDNLRPVFNADKIDMFKMNKVLGS